jgi:tetratricopeptide (TPR) repeat protein
MALALLSAICMLDSLGQITAATPLENQFAGLLGAQPEREPMARFWWNILVGMRAPYAHDDVWNALRHCDAIQAIYDLIPTDRIFLNMQLFRGLNLWFLGAFEAATPTLEAIPAADVRLGVASPLRRLGLAWLLADRGALDRARTVASELSEHGLARGYALDEGRGRWVLAEVLRRMGELDAAEREVQAALALAVPLEQPGVLGTLSALRLAQGRVAEAVAASEGAVARCTAMGGCGMFRGAFVRLARAEALHASGAQDAARHAIADAREHLLTIADQICDPAYQRSFLHNVPENARTLALARSWLGEPTSSV